MSRNNVFPKFEPLTSPTIKHGTIHPRRLAYSLCESIGQHSKDLFLGL